MQTDSPRLAQEASALFTKLYFLNSSWFWKVETQWTMGDFFTTDLYSRSVFPMLYKTIPDCVRATLFILSDRTLNQRASWTPYYHCYPTQITVRRLATTIGSAQSEGCSSRLSDVKSCQNATPRRIYQGCLDTFK